MKYAKKKHWRWGILALIVFANYLVWSVVYDETPSKYMTVAFLNVGQGDSIYIESPTHNRIIMDGGPDDGMLREMRPFVPWYCRWIDMLLVTNPDKDHYDAFIDLMARYGVGKILEPGTISPTPTYQVLEKTIADHHVPRELARRGMRINLGEGAYLDILFPDQDVSTWATNDGSIVSQLVYGSTTVMLTGDAPNKTEEYVLSLDGARVKSTILKEGHHGSRTSASGPFISAVAPDYSVISAGLNNMYGFPHKETVDLLNQLHIPMLLTFKLGTIVMKSNGIHYSITH